MEIEFDPAKDADNPEWTEADFARARAGSEILPPEFVTAFKRTPGRPAGTTKGESKQQVTLRLDPDVLEKFKATGKGWQSRINQALRRAQV